MSRSREQVISEIRFEMEQIDHLLFVYSDLLTRVQQRNPDTVEIAAVATVLHSFYNGVENIFTSVAKGIDESLPSGAQSHRELLKQVTKPTNQRRAVISDQNAEALTPYLGFRHFYRHSYSFVIDWEELKKLVVPLAQEWGSLKTSFIVFTKTLESKTK